MHEYVQQDRFTDFLIEYEGSRAGVKTLFFAHIIPPMSPKLAEFFATRPLFLNGVREIFS